MSWGWTSWLLLAAFLRPLAEAYILVAGKWWCHAHFHANPGRFSRYVIQMTTVGREEDRVNEIIDEIRAYPMTMPYEIWVVNEPGNGDVYPRADRVITVPKEFTARSQYKARALEYSRHIRKSLGYNGPDTKITFLDDDTSPTWKYLETAFAGDYDVSQGVTAPRIKYGALPLKHFVLSHIDDLRFHNCMTYCSSFQGIFHAPLFVHGEGLTVTGEAEDKVTWNYPIFASEDLTFGCNAASQGMSWGFFHEYIQLTSPWTWKAYFKQRRRWMWGNIHAIMHRDVLPLGPAIRISARYFLSLYTFIASAFAIGLIHEHEIQPPQWAFMLFWLSLLAWAANFALSGWINAGVREKGQTALRFWANRLWQTVMAVVLGPFTATWTIVALVSTIYMGNPKSFEVIAKTKETSKLREQRDQKAGERELVAAKEVA